MPHYRRRARRIQACFVLLSCAWLLSACAPRVTAEQPCYVDRTAQLADDQNPVARMSVANVGRWCGLVMSRNQGATSMAFSPAVLAEPQHGQARVRNNQGQSVVEYRPASGFTGSDEFRVQRGYMGGSVTVHVNVVPGGPARQAAPQPLPAAPPQITSPTLQPIAALPAAASAIQPLSGPMVFRCPRQGTVQSYPSGNSTTWLGIDPANTDVCIGRDQAGRPVSRIRNIWTPASFWPDTLPALRQAGARLYSAPAGEPVSFTATGSTGNAADPRPGTWTITLRVLGQEDIAIQAGTFRTYVIEYDERSAVGDGRWVYRMWFDQATGAYLRRAVVSSSDGRGAGADTASLRSPS